MIEALVDWLGRRIRDKKEQIVSGAAPDWETYRVMLAELRAFQDIQSKAKQLASLDDEDDDSLKELQG